MQWSLDPNGAIAHVSREWQQFTGLAEQDLIGRSDRLSVHLKDRGIVSNVMRNAINSHQPFAVCFRQKKSNQEFEWVIAEAAPAFSSVDGSFLGYLGRTKILENENEPQKATDLLHSVPNENNKIVLLDAIADHIIIARTISKNTG